jgi:predicted CopG family antitoxin
MLWDILHNNELHEYLATQAALIGNSIKKQLKTKSNSDVNIEDKDIQEKAEVAIFTDLIERLLDEKERIFTLMRDAFTDEDHNVIKYFISTEDRKKLLQKHAAICNQSFLNIRLRMGL